MSFSRDSISSFGLGRAAERAQQVNITSRHGRRNKIFGLSAGIFWVVVVIAVLMIGGSGSAVTGVVKRSLAPEPRYSAPEVFPQLYRTKVYTRTNGTIPSNTTMPIIKSPCDNNPGADGTYVIARDSEGQDWQYLVLCNTYIKATGTIIDIKRVRVPDLQACAEACSNYNRASRDIPYQRPFCWEVSIIKTPGEFCYLKTYGNLNNDHQTYGKPSDSAFLLSD